jgi:hypothetical protein
MLKMLVMPALVLLCSQTVSQAVSAAEDKEKVERARKYFEAGKQAYDAGMFGGAASAFEEAYHLSPRPQIAFSLAQAYRRQYSVDHDPATLKKAVEYLQGYVKDVPQGGRRSDALQFLADLEPLIRRAEEDMKNKSVMVASVKKPDPTQIMVSSRTQGAFARIDGGENGEVPLLREVTPGKHKIHMEAVGYFPEDVEELAVDNRLVVVELSLHEKPARIALNAPSGADIQVNGRPIGTTPLARPIEVAPGSNFLAITSRGAYAYTRELSLTHDQEVSLDVDLETTRQRQIAYGVLGVGAVTIATGVVTTVVALLAQKSARDIDNSINQRIHSNMNVAASDITSFDDDLHRRDRFVTVSEVLYGAGLGVVVVGALLYMIDTPRVEEPAIMRMTPPAGEPKPMDLAPSAPSMSFWFHPSLGGGALETRF